MALVCHCEAVSERAVRKAIRRGARSVAEVATVCGAASRCGGCIPVVEELLQTQVAVEPRLVPGLIA